MNGNRLIMIAGIVAGVLMLLGTFHLFILRFQTGDVYPPYSSLRSDPLGAKVLYESLAKCGLRSVTRNYLPLEKLRLGRGTTVLFLGDTLPFSSRGRIIDSALAGSVNSSLRGGARMVITLMPQNTVYDETRRAEEKPRKKKIKRNAGGKDQDASDEEDEERDEEKAPKHLISFYDWLGVDIGNQPVYGNAVATLNPDMTSSALPSSLACHTSLCLTNLVNDWRVVYKRGDKPVVIERPFGNGSMVISALAYFASNEAMKDERQPALLSWLIGASEKVVFDEYHLDIGERPNTAKLMRKYGLHWFGAALFLLAALFIWQNSFSLVPPHKHSPEDNAAEETATGKDSAAGLVNLLRRNIPPGSILGVCFAEWKKTANLRGQESESKMLELGRLAENSAGALPGKRHLVETYNKMCGVLKRKKTAP